MSQPAAAVGPRLSVMMFLQFFIWGSWYVTVGNYMAAMGMAESIGWAYTVGPIAAIISPFFLGMVADRYFATERVLGIMHILGGIALLLAPMMAQISVDNWAAMAAEFQSQGIDPQEKALEYVVNPAHYPFIGILLVHMLCFMPTLGLTNTLAFHNITDQEKQFPMIRVFGTIGWIVANVLVSRILHADEQALPLQIAGGAGIVLGIYSFTLPHTPPPSAGQKATVKDVLGLDSLALMKNWSFAVFMVSSMAICVPLAAYYAFAQVFVNHAGFHDPAFYMSFGQMSEIFFMLVMPFFFKRLGVKWMLFVGMLAWVVRYGLFSLGADEGVVWMILMGIVLHGICYDFFFVTGQIYVDKKAPPKIRGQAQGFLVLMTQGVGLGIGAVIVQKLVVNPNKAENITSLETQAKSLRDQWEGLSDQTTAQAAELWQKSTDLLLQTHNWENIWQICAIMAGVIMVLFLALFHDDTKATPTEGEIADAYAENVPEDPNERHGG